MFTGAVRGASQVQRENERLHIVVNTQEPLGCIGQSSGGRGVAGEEIVSFFGHRICAHAARQMQQKHHCVRAGCGNPPGRLEIFAVDAEFAHHRVQRRPVQSETRGRAGDNSVALAKNAQDVFALDILQRQAAAGCRGIRR